MRLLLTDASSGLQEPPIAGGTMKLSFRSPPSRPAPDVVEVMAEVQLSDRKAGQSDNSGGNGA